MTQSKAVHREGVSFESEGTRCAAWLYRPDDSTVTQTEHPPIVVMANGFGLPRRAGLPAIAERFAERGLAVLVFDYRSLGDSDGEPRNVVLPFGQISDWQAAVRFARTIDDVDGERLGVWGFSLGAGGALFAAANENVDAYVGQTPIFDGGRTLFYIVRQMGPVYGLRTTMAGLRDLAHKYTRRAPYYIPIWGDYPDELPALPTPGSEEGHEAVAGEDAHDEDVNRCAARAFLTFGLYRPIKKANDVECPTMIVEGANDQIAPGSAIEKTASRLNDVTWIAYDTDHFGAFFGELFEEVVERESTFFERHLLKAESSEASRPQTH
ncbi:alpha/beta hydrolase [Saliphagus sp. LR7]|uniref:alpha/beta hydrolase n=1 Tax=Saliphagus sp. LR7 TaxID=2282654 RepID=UPI000DF7E013|nr:alpha/beta fold hydrolase [Saliphagus sp. LR7]